MPDAQIYIQDYSRPEKIRRQSTSKKHVQKIANPTPLGLSAFAIAVTISSLYNLKTLGIVEPNLLVGMGLFTGGIVQFAAGMWEFKTGNTFGATGFSAYGGFWLSYGVIFIPGFGILDGFKDHMDHFHNAMGIYLLTWTIFTVLFTLGCIRTNIGVLAAFVFLSLAFVGETFYSFYPDTEAFIKLAGVSGLICGTCVWYTLASAFLTPDLSPINLPLWDLSHKD